MAPFSMVATSSILLVMFAALLALVESFIMNNPHDSRCGGSLKRHASASSSSTASVDEPMLNTYDALAMRLIERYEKDAAANNLRNDQLFVCVAGGPGSGKSTLSDAVAERIRERMQDNDEGVGESSSSSPAAVVLPMDGFHYSRSRLRSMGESPDVEHTYDELLARRGAPWTFDAEACVDAFSRARRDGKASLPVYSRAKSDPVPDGVQLHAGTKIVLLEGNYLLAWEDERWAPLRTHEVFDETWYISCKSLEEQRERLVKRHLETWSDEKTKMFGEGALGAGNKADANDMLNLKWIDEMSRKYADHVIESI